MRRAGESPRLVRLRGDGRRAGLGLFLGAGLLLAVAPSAHGQGQALEPGREVRLFVRGVIAPFEGTLLAVSASELTVATANVGELTLSREQVDRSEVLGSRGNAVRGGIIGLGVSLVVGIAAVIGSRDRCDRDIAGFCAPLRDRVDRWLLVAPPLAGGGGGALLGSRVRSSEWVPGFLPPVTADAGLGLRVAWSLAVGP